MTGFENKPYSKDDYDKNTEDAESLKKQMAGAKSADEMMAIAMKMKAVEENEKSLMDNAEEEAGKEDAEMDMMEEAKAEDAERTKEKEEAAARAKELEELKKKDEEESAAKVEEILKKMNGAPVSAEENHADTKDQDDALEKLKSRYANIEKKAGEEEILNEKKLLEKNPNSLTAVEIQSLSVDTLKDLYGKHGFDTFGKKLDSLFKGEIANFSDLYKGNKSMSFGETIGVLANLAHLGEVFNKLGSKAKGQLSELFDKSLEVNKGGKIPFENFYMAIAKDGGRSIEVLIKAGVVSKEVIVNSLKEFVAASKLNRVGDSSQMDGIIIEKLIGKGVLSSDEAVALAKEMADKKKQG